MQPHILFLDDDKLDIKALKRGNALPCSAHYFQYSSDLFAMLKVLKKINQLPVLIMTDLYMPNAQGSAVLTKLKAYYPGIKTGVFSGLDQRSAPKAHLGGEHRIGKTFFVSKDEGVEALMQRIAKELGL